MKEGCVRESVKGGVYERHGDREETLAPSVPEDQDRFFQPAGRASSPGGSPESLSLLEPPRHPLPITLIQWGEESSSHKRKREQQISGGQLLLPWPRASLPRKLPGFWGPPGPLQAPRPQTWALHQQQSQEEERPQQQGKPRGAASPAPWPGSPKATPGLGGDTRPASGGGRKGSPMEDAPMHPPPPPPPPRCQPLATPGRTRQLAGLTTEKLLAEQ